MRDKILTVHKLFVFLIIALFAMSVVFAAYGPGDAAAVIPPSSSSPSTDDSSTTSSDSSGGSALPASVSDPVVVPVVDDTTDETGEDVVDQSVAPVVAVEESEPVAQNFAGRAFEAAGKIVLDLSYLWIGVVLIAGLLFIAIGIRRHVKAKKK